MPVMTLCCEWLRFVLGLQFSRQGDFSQRGSESDFSVLQGFRGTAVRKCSNLLVRVEVRHFHTPAVMYTEPSSFNHL